MNISFSGLRGSCAPPLIVAPAWCWIVILMATGLAPLKLAAAAAVAKPPAGRAEPGRRHETALGELVEASTFAGSVQLVFDGKKCNVVRQTGFIVLAQGEAYEIQPAALGVVPGRQNRPRRSVKFVQDAKSGRWLATEGFLVLWERNCAVMDGQTIEVVGGKSKPLTVGGRPCPSGTFHIKDGLAIPVSGAGSDSWAEKAEPLGSKPDEVEGHSGLPAYLGLLGGRNSLTVSNGGDQTVTAAVRLADTGREPMTLTNLTDLIAVANAMAKDFNAIAGADFQFGAVLLRGGAAGTGEIEGMSWHAGVDLVVAPGSAQSVNLPNGKFDLFVKFASEPKAIYQGEPISVPDPSQGFGLGTAGASMVTITLNSSTNGNYRVRRIR